MQPIRGRHSLSLSLLRGQGEWDLRGLLSTKEGHHSTFSGTHVLFGPPTRLPVLRRILGEGLVVGVYLPARPLIRPPRGGSNPLLRRLQSKLAAFVWPPFAGTHARCMAPGGKGWTSGGWEKMHLKTQMHFPAAAACPGKNLRGEREKTDQCSSCNPAQNIFEYLYNMLCFVKNILCLWYVAGV